MRTMDWDLESATIAPSLRSAVVRGKNNLIAGEVIHAGRERLYRKVEYPIVCMVVCTQVGPGTLHDIRLLAK